MTGITAEALAEAAATAAGDRALAGRLLAEGKLLPIKGRWRLPLPQPNKRAVNLAIRPRKRKR